MSHPIPVPASVYYGLGVVLDAEAYFMSVRSYISCAAELGLYSTARWISAHPAAFGQGLLYGFVPSDPDEAPIPVLRNFSALRPAAA